MIGQVVRLDEKPLFASADGAQLFRNTIGRDDLGKGALEAGWYALKPGTRNHLDVHPHNDEYYFIKAGEGVLYMDDAAHPITAGDSVWVPKGCQHYIVNDGPELLELFYLYAPPVVRNPDAPKMYFPVEAEPA